MRTSYQIYCDYVRAIAKANSLDLIAGRLTNIAQREIMDEMIILENSWHGDSMRRVQQKGSEISQDLLYRARKIRTIADTIRKIARRNYNAEMRALELARKREYGGGGFR